MESDMLLDIWKMGCVQKIVMWCRMKFMEERKSLLLSTFKYSPIRGQPRRKAQDCLYILCMPAFLTFRVGSDDQKYEKD